MQFSRVKPYEVFYPLLLVGTLSFFIPMFLQGVVRRHYEDLELRKMTAHDLATPSLRR